MKRPTDRAENPGKPLLLEENRILRDLRPGSPSDMMRLQIQGVSRIPALSTVSASRSQIRFASRHPSRSKAERV
jgi:hypothetical protein